MKKTFAALLAVATVAGALSATPANAQRALGAAVAGGIIGGAIVGGAIAAQQAPAPGYVGPGPGPCAVFGLIVCANAASTLTSAAMTTFPLRWQSVVRKLNSVVATRTGKARPPI